MCGVAGLWRRGGGPKDALGQIAGAMSETLTHRGPDDQGVWVDEEAGIALASRRLAIIDLSPEGRMPMRSASGRYQIVYNGEVYNSRDIARQIEQAGRAPVWRGHSDTEVLLAAVEAWGLDGALERFNGMFVFALWDHDDRALHLVRDRLGIKPLYVATAGQELLFASELRAFTRHPGFADHLDRAWLDDYLRGSRVSTDRTVYANASSVTPGTYVTLSEGRARRTVTYWSVAERAAGQMSRFAGSEHDAVDAVADILGDAVRLRLVSDVQLGVLLSGGIDSATVLALAQQASGTMRSFSIGFSQREFDEAPHARVIANHLGAKHTELYVEPRDMLDVIPTLARSTDMPISDPSWVSNWFAYRLAGQHVTVALAGDGGDEVFGGYHRHRWLPRVWRTAGRVPPSVRAALGRAVRTIRPSTWDSVFSLLGPMLPARARERSPGAKLHRGSRWLGAPTPEAMYAVLASRWDHDANLVVGQPPTFDAPFTFAAPHGEVGLLDRMLIHELTSYLPDTQLTKVDRASMGVSVEARVPMLDHRVVELALTLSPELKVRGELGKYVLRGVLDRHVPTQLMERPKMGFHLPLDVWLRGPLRPWAEDLLHPDRLRDQGIFVTDTVAAAWAEHLGGRHDRSYQLWPILMFQAWQS